MRRMKPVVFCSLVLVLCGYKISYAEISLVKIQAVDRTGAGVIGYVLMFKNYLGDGEMLDETDEAGNVTFVPPVMCKQSYRIRIIPENIIRYEQTKKKRCQSVVTYLVKLRGVNASAVVLNAKDKNIVVTLFDRAKEIRKRDDYGSAVLVYTELATRLRTKQPAIARNYEGLIPINAAKKLNVKNAVYVDPDTGKLLISSDLKHAIKDYQRFNGIKESGKLDNETVVKMAGNPNWVYLYKSSSSKSGLVLQAGIQDIQKEKIILNNLAKNIDEIEKTNNYSLAALLNTEYAARIRKLPKDIQAGIPLSARESEIKSYQLLGQYLKVDNPLYYDPVQNREVVSGEMGRALKNYQAQNSLKPTGTLSYATLQKMSGENISPYLYNIIAQEVRQ